MGPALQGLRVLVLGAPPALAAPLERLGAQVSAEAWPSSVAGAGAAWRAWAARLPVADVVFAWEPSRDAPWRESLSHAVAGAVVVACSHFGLHGPDGALVGSDLIASARSGMLSLCGHAGLAPQRPVACLAHHALVLHANVAALLGLLRGGASFADVSAQEAAASMLDHALPAWLFEGRVHRRAGDDPHLKTTFASPCADGFIQVNVASQWEVIVDWMAADGMAGALAGPRWRDADWRSRHFTKLREAVGRWTRTRRVADLFHTAQAMRLPWVPVRSAAALDSCEQLAARASQSVDPVVATGAWSASAVARDGMPLAGVRVLDFTWVLAGPYATRLLADLG